MLSKKRRASEKVQGRKTNKRNFKLKETVQSMLSKEKIGRMTPKRLRKFKGFEKISKKEAKEIIRTLEMYCQMILHHLKLKKKDI